jgi:hypothetical protein
MLYRLPRQRVDACVAGLPAALVPLLASEDSDVRAAALAVAAEVAGSHASLLLLQKVCACVCMCAWQKEGGAVACW